MNIPYDSSALDAILVALANQKRRSIIHDLSLHPATIGRLANHNNLSLPAIHKHMRILEDTKLIVRKKAGRTNFVALNSSTLSLVQAWIMQFHTAWGSTEATLENYISKMKE
jgi:DNA-binding transcriptional ArsR family regulator